MIESTFTPLSGAVGGALIGIASVLLLLANGRIAGVSGIVSGLLIRTPGDVAWRAAFVIGLWIGAAIYWLVRGELFAVTVTASLPTTLAAGLLVGFGTRLAGGCTSGHGICGIARLSKRSIAATIVFIAAAMLTVFVARNVAG